MYALGVINENEFKKKKKKKKRKPLNSLKNAGMTINEKKMHK